MIVTPTENTKYMYSAVEYCTSLLFWETEVDYRYIREVKHDVYGRRQTAKITSDFLFFSCNP